MNRHLYYIAITFAGLLALALISRRAGPPSAGSFGGVELASLSGAAARRLDACPTPKCLTVYVAPWCGVCRSSTGMLAAFRDYLRARGVETRLVVGRGEPEAVRKYAEEFGPDTLLDPEGRVPLSGGVPNFIASSADGTILKRMPGVPGIYEPPYPEGLFREFAEHLGLL